MLVEPQTWDLKQMTPTRVSADRKKSQEILIDQFQFPIYLHITETQKTFKGGVPKSRGERKLT